MIRVLIADDHALVRSGFSMILAAEPDIDVVGTAADGVAACEMARQLRPDVTLMDVQMPLLDGIEATRIIAAEGLSKVIVLTTFDRDDYLCASLDAGAAGFLLKNTEPERLSDAIRVVADSRALLSPDVTMRVVPQLPQRTAQNSAIVIPQLEHGVEFTSREKEVFQLVIEGLSNAEIADVMVLGEATVKTHISNILAKVGVRDRVQVVVWAYRHGWTIASSR
ncbi:MAG: response regulator [Propionibacteriaceae bacterium]